MTGSNCSVAAVRLGLAGLAIIAALVGVVAKAETLQGGEGQNAVELGDGYRSDKEGRDGLVAAFLEHKAIIRSNQYEDIQGRSLCCWRRGLVEFVASDDEFIGAVPLLAGEDYAATKIAEPSGFCGDFLSKFFCGPTQG